LIAGRQHICILSVVLMDTFEACQELLDD
jgi:hypothetical protein